MSDSFPHVIAILCPGFDWGSSYSVNAVICETIRFLAKKHIKVRVLCSKEAGAWKAFDGVHYIPELPLYSKSSPESPNAHSTLKASWKEVLEKHLSDVSIVITHDLLFLKSLLAINEAVREIGAQISHLRWIHWVHSTPSEPSSELLPDEKRLRFSAMAKSLYISVSATHRQALATMLNCSLEKIHTIPNPRFSALLHNMDPISNKLMDHCSFLDADVSILYPANVRRQDKQHEIILFIAAELKKLGKRVSVIFASRNETPEDKDAYGRILVLTWLARQLGLSESECIFTFDHSADLHKGTPEHIVFELFQCSNVFILPSLGESCSLALLEACATKNLCVVNSNVASNREIVGEAGMSIAFDNLGLELEKRYGEAVRHNSILSYYHEELEQYRNIAKRILDTLQSSLVLSTFHRAHTHYRSDVIFEKQLLPLFEKVLSHEA